MIINKTDINFQFVTNSGDIIDQIFIKNFISKQKLINYGN